MAALKPLESYLPQTLKQTALLSQQVVHKSGITVCKFFHAITIAIMIDYSYNYSQSPAIIATKVGVLVGPTRTCATDAIESPDLCHTHTDVSRSNLVL